MKLVSCCACGRVADTGPASGLLHGWVMNHSSYQSEWPPDTYVCLQCFAAAYTDKSMEQRTAYLADLRLRVATTRALEGK